MHMISTDRSTHMSGARKNAKDMFEESWTRDYSSDYRKVWKYNLKGPVNHIAKG